MYIYKYKCIHIHIFHKISEVFLNFLKFIPDVQVQAPLLKVPSFVNQRRCIKGIMYIFNDISLSPFRFVNATVECSLQAFLLLHLSVLSSYLFKLESNTFLTALLRYNLHFITFPFCKYKIHRFLTPL